MTDKVKEAAERLEHRANDLEEIASSPNPVWDLTVSWKQEVADLRTVLSALRERGEALEAAIGYMANAKIDLETATKAKAVKTLDEGMVRVRNVGAAR